jgi:peptidoglycan/xylan/chitin deacetylase (PgdA/CDA1 family)
MTVAAYSPPRGAIAKVTRRLTQWRAARPAALVFDQPILSICFDDFPQSAGIEGARVLQAHGARGTYYASAALAERDGPSGPGFTGADLKRLAWDGHEIGCHTFAHHDCARVPAYDALLDLARNRDALTAMGHNAPLTALAYPYGETSIALKESLPPRYRTARGVLPGLNVGAVDLAQLRSYPLFGEGALKRARAALTRAAKRNAWMIAFTHDVAQAPSPWGTSSRDLDDFIRAAHRAGFLVLPVTAALERAV